jgi:hypothetical protein
MMGYNGSGRTGGSLDAVVLPELSANAPEGIIGPKVRHHLLEGKGVAPATNLCRSAEGAQDLAALPIDLLSDPYWSEGRVPVEFFLT